METDPGSNLCACVWVGGAGGGGGCFHWELVSSGTGAKDPPSTPGSGDAKLTNQTVVLCLRCRLSSPSSSFTVLRSTSTSTSTAASHWSKSSDPRANGQSNINYGEQTQPSMNNQGLGWSHRPNCLSVCPSVSASTRVPQVGATKKTQNHKTGGLEVWRS